MASTASKLAVIPEHVYGYVVNEDVDQKTFENVLAPFLSEMDIRLEPYIHNVWTVKSERGCPFGQFQFRIVWNDSKALPTLHIERAGLESDIDQAPYNSGFFESIIIPHLIKEGLVTYVKRPPLTKADVQKILGKLPKFGKSMKKSKTKKTKKSMKKSRKSKTRKSKTRKSMRKSKRVKKNHK